MAHLLIGDGHYTGRPNEAGDLAELLEQAAAHGVKEVSILGDFLELWIGLQGMEEPWHAELLAPLGILKRKGVKLRYVVGNKDYFISEWNARHGLFDEVIEREVALPSPHGPLYLAHGDLVNTRDKQYRAWRWFSRSLLVRTFARLLPRRLLARLSQRIAKRLAATNIEHKSYFPREELIKNAQQRSESNLTMVYGHFHVFEHLKVDDKNIYTLPFLLTEKAGLWVDAQGCSRFPATEERVSEAAG